MRLLHAGSDLLGQGFDLFIQAEDGIRDPRVDERQHLPLRGVPEHCRGDSIGHADDRKERKGVNSFSYTRAGDVAGAVNEAATNRAAKFIAGGTNLIDLMKENVARPTR